MFVVFPPWVMFSVVELCEATAGCHSESVDSQAARRNCLRSPGRIVSAAVPSSASSAAGGSSPVRAV